MTAQTMILGQRSDDHIALTVIDRVLPPDWTEPALKVQVSGNSTDVRFKTFETLIAVEDLRIFLQHLREAERDTTVGGYLQSAGGEIVVKLRGQGTGTFELDCEVADAPELRKPRPRRLVLYPKDIPRLTGEIEAAIGDAAST